MSSVDAVHYSADPVHRGIESIVNKNSDLVQMQVNDFKARLQEMAMFLADVERTDLVSHASLLPPPEPLSPCMAGILMSGYPEYWSRLDYYLPTCDHITRLYQDQGTRSKSCYAWKMR